MTFRRCTVAALIATAACYTIAAAALAITYRCALDSDQLADVDDTELDQFIHAAQGPCPDHGCPICHSVGGQR